MIASSSAKGARTATLKHLVGSGDRIVLFTLPVLLSGVVLNVLFPPAFQVGGPPSVVRVVASVVLAAGVVIWAWSVVLILTSVPRGVLITKGPYSLVKHPLYTGVALLVLPFLGLLLNTWLGVVIGITMYIASRKFAPAEEVELSQTFGAAWNRYRDSVTFRWM